MADTSLKALTNSIGSIATHQVEIDKNVKDIRDAVCGSDSIRVILKSINDQINVATKKGLLSKVGGKNIGLNDKFNKKIIRSTDSIIAILSKIFASMQKMGGKGIGKLDLRSDKSRGNNRLDSMSKSLDIIAKLRDIKLKDFIFAKTKMKHISDLMMKFKEMFKNFKNKKEMEATVSFANSSIEIVKKLAKVTVFAAPAKLGIKAIEKIFFGDKKGTGGLLEIFRKVDLHKKQIKAGKKSMTEILAATGAMFLTTILLAPIAVLGIPAMLGALTMKGIVWIMSGTFEMLNKAKKDALIGSLALLIMSTSLITFALGLGFMVKAVKDMKWKDFGMMMASIGAISAVLTLLGIPAVSALVALGSITLLAMGTGLLVFGIGLGKTSDAVKNIEWKTFGRMLGQIAATGTAMAGLGLLSIPIGIGAGALLLMGGALKKFASAINEWSKLKNINPALTNIKNAVKSVKDVVKDKFDMKPVRQLGRVGKQLLKLYEGIKDWDKLNGSKIANNINTIISTIQTVLKGKLDNKDIKVYGKLGRYLRRLSRGISEWEEIQAKKASDNIAYAITHLKEAFSNDAKTNGMINVTKTLVEVTNMSKGIIDTLKIWDEYTPGNAISNIDTTINGLLSAFGMNEDKKNEAKIEKAVTGKNKFWDRVKSELKSVDNGIAGAVKQVASNAKNAIHNNGVKRTMSTLKDIMGSLGDIRNFITPWEGNETSGGIDNITRAIKSINKLDIEKASVMIDVFKSFSRIGYRPFDKFTEAVYKFSDSCNDLIKALDNFEPVTNVTTNENDDTTVSSNSISIKNTEDFAQAIANAIKSLPINVETNMSDVRLVVNGESGRRVILTLDN